MPLLPPSVDYTDKDFDALRERLIALLQSVFPEWSNFAVAGFGNKAILMAMKSNEDDTNAAYERAVAHLGLGVDVTTILEKHLADERRHREYIVTALQGLRSESRPSTPSAV